MCGEVNCPRKKKKKKLIYFEPFYDKELITVNTVTQP